MIKDLCMHKSFIDTFLLSKNVQAKDPDHPGGDRDFFCLNVFRCIGC